MTTVCGSGAVAWIGLSETVSPVARGDWLLGSIIVSSVNTTSADVIGSPSDHVRPGLRCIVYVLPSGDTSQRSASQGSISWVARLTRTRWPWVSRAMRSVNWSRAARRLKERGSERADTIIWPPRCGAAGGAAGPRRQREARPRRSATASTTRTIRENFTVYACYRLESAPGRHHGPVRPGTFVRGGISPSSAKKLAEGPEPCSSSDIARSFWHLSRPATPPVNRLAVPSVRAPIDGNVQTLVNPVTYA